VCWLLDHKKRYRALNVSGHIYTWITCKRCGRHVSGIQPPWDRLLEDAVRRFA